MADGIEQKLNMSLDDLAKQEKREEVSKHRRGGFQRQQGRFGAHGRIGQVHQQRQYREQQQPLAFSQPGLPHSGPRDIGWRQMQQGSIGGRGMPAEQQGWQAVSNGQGGPQRPSVFERLSALPRQQFEFQQQPQHVQPYVQPQPAPPRQRQQFRAAVQLTPSQPKVAAPELQCRLDKETGLVIIQHKGTDIVKVGPAGDVTLDSGADQSDEHLAAMNTALSHIHMSVKKVGDNWSVSDGKGLFRFADGMKLPAKGPLTAGRAMVLLQALTAGHSKAAATAAQQASTQAAIAAGIMPRGAGPPGSSVEEASEAANIRRLKAQGRYAPY